MIRATQLAVCLLLLIGSESFAGEALSGEELAKANGCLKCHNAEAKNNAPSFRMIRRQSEAGLNEFKLTLMSLKSEQELPAVGKKSVIVAKVNDKTHVRIFDATGAQVADKADAKLSTALPGPALVIAAAERRKLVAEAAVAVGYESAQSRAKLIQTVKHGGKGQWTHLTKGKPMPPFGGHLTDAEIGRLVDFVLLGGASPSLRTMATGLGEGTIAVTPPGPYSVGQTVTLTAIPAAGSKFVRWEADATGPAMTTTLTINDGHSVRAVFAPTKEITKITDVSPEGLKAYLAANTQVNTPARFLAALPDVYRQNWILMTRSESLQTGTAVSPRILLPSPNGKDVFTIGMATSSSYPGSHPNAVEYMQWDGAVKNFRFHEIVLDAIPEMGDEIKPDPNNPALRVKPFPARARGVTFDDVKCSRCHSTQNVVNNGTTPGTDGLVPKTLQVKNKPNWDTYDSWGGMMPFNRDRIYKGSVEAAAFRNLMNPWTWEANPPVRQVLEQLYLQPPTLATNHPHFIDRQVGGPDDGHVKFKFDDEDIVSVEPEPASEPTLDGTSNYSFDRVESSDPGTSVRRGPQFVTLFHSDIVGSDEGRGVRLFDNLSGTLTSDLNPVRIADELANHPGPIDIRPLVLALSIPDLLTINTATQSVDTRSGLPPLGNKYAFFNSRHGMMLNALREDTRKRAVTVPRRKGDIQRLNLDRLTDPYLVGPENGLIQQFGAQTSAFPGPAPGTDTSIPRLRQEIFRRPPDDQGAPDVSEMKGSLVDRESYGFNTDKMTLYRYFLEPLGVSVDKWSMGVRGRSRTYAFADVFGNYPNAIAEAMKASLDKKPFPGLTDVNDEEQLINAVNVSLNALPATTEVPSFTNVQRIFNKGCIECHGGLNYPPYRLFDPFGSLNFAEDESPPTGSTRLRRSHILAERYTNYSTTPADSRLMRFILKDDETCSPSDVEMMPCGGPKLSDCDIQTLLRWVQGGQAYTLGDPHIRTIGGVDYDFQAAGEFVLLRGETLEIQVRQIGVTSARQLGPNPYTGLTSCVSVNGAVAFRIGQHRVTYQPGANGMELRVNGEVKTIPEGGLTLPQAGRLVRVGDAGGFQIEARGGAVVVVMPAFWEHYQLWYLNIDCRKVRGTEGLMGNLAPGSWLPAKADGTSVGALPAALAERHKDLYQDFGNSWRVTDSTSLFDYEAGTSTKSFTVENWPAFDAKACVAPKVPHGPLDKPAQEPITNEKAVELTQGIADKKLRELAIQDIMATGEAGFAKAYQSSNAIRLHRPPGVPVLAIGQNRLVNAAPRLTWTKARPQPNTTLTYKLYVWPVYDPPNEDNFIRITADEANRDPRTITKALADLKPGQSYYWKIVVDDGKGGTSESLTEKFKVK